MHNRKQPTGQSPTTYSRLHKPNKKSDWKSMLKIVVICFLVAGCGMQVRTLKVFLLSLLSLTFFG